MVQLLQRKQYGYNFLKILNIQLPYDPAILLLGIYPKKQKQGLKQILYTHVHGIINKGQKREEATQVSTARWINNTGHFVNIQWNVLQPWKEGNSDIWMKLDKIMPSESQSQQDKCYMIPVTWNSYTKQIHRNKTKWWLPGAESNRELYLIGIVSVVRFRSWGDGCIMM